MTKQVLIVEDDEEIADLLVNALQGEGYLPQAVKNGRDMFDALQAGHFDVILLDIMLPGRDGLALCRDIRAYDPHIAIIIISAKDGDVDKIIGLEMGADDYLPKPFNSRELVARIRALERRLELGSNNKSDHEQERIRTVLFGPYRLDTGQHTLVNMETSELIHMTSGEFSLLSALAEHMYRPIDRDRLLTLTQGREAVPYDRSIDVLIGRLRKKIEADPSNPVFIKTVRNKGYMLTGYQGEDCKE